MRLLHEQTILVYPAQLIDAQTKRQAWCLQMTAEAEQTSKTLLHYLLFTSSQCSNNSIVHQFWFSNKLCKSLTILSFTICRSKSDKHLYVWTIFIFLFHPPICCQQLTRIVLAHIKIRILMTQYSNTTIKCSQCSQISISNKSDNITIYPHNRRREEKESKQQT